MVATDIRIPPPDSPVLKGKYQYADVKSYQALESIIVDNRIGLVMTSTTSIVTSCVYLEWVVHLSALLSFAAEKNPSLAIDLNNIGTQNILELARIHKLRVFSPSTIGAFGPSTPYVRCPVMVSSH